MTKTEPIMGSAEWADLVFGYGPERELKGQSKWTQYHGYQSNVHKAKMELQGRNECVSSLTLEYLITQGLISRIKAQPFSTVKVEFGDEITPDFLAEGTDEDGTLYVIETKSARFFSHAIKRRHENFRVKFEGYGLNYIVWTDEYPITRWLKHNLINMRRASCMPEMQDQDINELVDWVERRRSSQATVANMYETNLTREVLWAAAWAGKAFFELTKELTRNTVITLSPQEDYAARFLNQRLDWWASLKRV
jgi:hypothetical protein